jgi:hypothetical protein
MFKKYLFTALVFSVFAGLSLAVEYAEPILECDEKFDICAEKCGETSPDSCFDNCETASNQCYKTYVYEDGSVPQIIEEDED